MISCLDKESLKILFGQKRNLKGTTASVPKIQGAFDSDREHAAIGSGGGESGTGQIHKIYDANALFIGKISFHLGTQIENGNFTLQ